MSRTRKDGERVSGLFLFSVQLVFSHLPLCLVCLPRRCIFLRQILILLRHTVLHLLSFRETASPPNSRDRISFIASMLNGEHLIPYSLICASHQSRGYLLMIYTW